MLSIEEVEGSRGSLLGLEVSPTVLAGFGSGAEGGIDDEDDDADADR